MPTEKAVRRASGVGNEQTTRRSGKTKRPPSAPSAESKTTDGLLASPAVRKNRRPCAGSSKTAPRCSLKTRGSPVRLLRIWTPGPRPNAGLARPQPAGFCSALASLAAPRGRKMYRRACSCSDRGECAEPSGYPRLWAHAARAARACLRGGLRRSSPRFSEEPLAQPERLPHRPRLGFLPEAGPSPFAGGQRAEEPRRLRRRGELFAKLVPVARRIRALAFCSGLEAGDLRRGRGSGHRF